MSEERPKPGSLPDELEDEVLRILEGSDEERDLALRELLARNPQHSRTVRSWLASAGVELHDTVISDHGGHGTSGGNGNGRSPCSHGGDSTPTTLDHGRMRACTPPPLAWLPPAPPEVLPSTVATPRPPRLAVTMPTCSTASPPGRKLKKMMSAGRASLWRIAQPAARPAASPAGVYAHWRVSSLRRSWP